MSLFKVGFDIHGVIDKDPKLFSKLTKRLISGGYEVHILTGQEWESVTGELRDWGIGYTHHFSILDYCKEQGHPIMIRGESKWVDGGIWDSAKGEYAKRVGLGIHFDNDLHYGRYFPEGCIFVHLSNIKEVLIEDELRNLVERFKEPK